MPGRCFYLAFSFVMLYAERIDTCQTLRERFSCEISKLKTRTFREVSAHNFYLIRTKYITWTVLHDVTWGSVRSTISNCWVVWGRNSCLCFGSFCYQWSLLYVDNRYGRIDSVRSVSVLSQLTPIDVWKLWSCLWIFWWVHSSIQHLCFFSKVTGKTYLVVFHRTASYYCDMRWPVCFT